MKIIDVSDLALSGVRVLRYEKFKDERGYFSEIFRLSDISKAEVLGNLKIEQSNESYSKKNVIRGLHFQWNPYMGKLVRTIFGHMVDIVLDIRVRSPNFGKVIFYDMPSTHLQDWSEWIWVPPGFAHGNFFLEDSQIEYFCTSSYNPECERSISPFSNDLDFSLADESLKKLFENLVTGKSLVSEKDKAGLSVSDWKNDSNSNQFLFDSSSKTS